MRNDLVKQDVAVISSRSAKGNTEGGEREVQTGSTQKCVLMCDALLALERDTKTHPGNFYPGPAQWLQAPQEELQCGIFFRKKRDSFRHATHILLRAPAAQSSVLSL